MREGQGASFQGALLAGREVTHCLLSESVAAQQQNKQAKTKPPIRVIGACPHEPSSTVFSFVPSQAC